MKAYCLKCQKETWKFYGKYTGFEPVHFNLYHGVPLTVSMCHGPFASCPPPEDRPDWDLDEPSPAELEIMNRNAEILMFDLRGLE